MGVKQRELTKLTVQEALNKEHYTAYDAVYGNPGTINTSSGALISGATFSTSNGSETLFATTDDRGEKIVWSKVSVECDQISYIQLADKNGTLGPIMYFEAAHLPVTFTGYDITDVYIKTTDDDAIVGVIAWR